MVSRLSILSLIDSSAMSHFYSFTRSPCCNQICIARVNIHPVVFFKH